MTIFEWRQNPNLVKQTAALLADPFVVQMLHVLKDRRDTVGVPIGVTPDDKAMLLGMRLGRDAMLDDLYSLAVFQNVVTEPEATYEKPE